MYKVVTQEKEIRELIKEGIEPLKALEDADVYAKVVTLIQCLNLYYGSERDLKKDLGGYVVLVYGNSADIKNTNEKILAYHHLGAEDYEFEDIFHVPECSSIVTFRLFLCSSDYSVEIILFEREKEE